MLVIFSPGETLWVLQRQFTKPRGYLEYYIFSNICAEFLWFLSGSYINNHPMQPLFYYLKSVSSVTPFKRPLLHLPPDTEKTQGLFSAKRWKCMSPPPQVPLNCEFSVVRISLSPLSFLRWELGASLRTLWTPKDTGQISQELSYHTLRSLPLAPVSPGPPLMTAGQGKCPLGEERELHGSPVRLGFS